MQLVFPFDRLVQIHIDSTLGARIAQRPQGNLWPFFVLPLGTIRYIVSRYRI